MMKRSVVVLLLTFLAASSLVGQSSCQHTTTTTNLINLIPNNLNVTNTSANQFDFLNEAIGSQVSDLPLATPASGVTYTYNPKNNVSVPSNETLGSILTQRAETIGRHKFYIAFTYQYFQFEDIDSVGLKNLPVVLQTANGTTFTATNNRIDLNVNQYASYLTFGVSNNIDVSIAVPVVNVNERITTSGVEYGILSNGNIGTAVIPSCSSAGSATGVGDIILAAKGWIWKMHRHGGDSGGFSVGAEVRLPTGNSSNFLGAGTVGVRPFAVFTYGGHFSPHANIAYEANGNTNLITNSVGQYQQLPNRLIYSGGVDWGITPRLTIVADIIAQRVVNAQRVGVTTFSPTFIVPAPPYPSIVPINNVSYNRVDGAGGFKLKPFSSNGLLITGNLSIKMNEAGLRTRLAPLGGLSITF